MKIKMALMENSPLSWENICSVPVLGKSAAFGNVFPLVTEGQGITENSGHPR